jgi:hypothetical protein
MMEQPGTRRATIRQGKQDLEIIIPAETNRLALFFLGVWLLAWAFAEVLVIRGMFIVPSPLEDIPPGLMYFWLAIWTISGLLALHQFLWILKGKEVIRLGPSTLTIAHQLLGYQWAKQYDLDSIRNLGVNEKMIEPGVSGFNYRFKRRRIIPGSLVFDYGYRTITFAADIDLIEARYLVEQLKASSRLEEAHFAAPA